MSKPISYNRTVLAPSVLNRGNNKVTLAAIQDYVGAVYGEDGAVSFDGTFTAAEKFYVQRTFGVLKDVSDVKNYLSNARQLFFKRHIGNDLLSDQSCDNVSVFQSQTFHTHFEDGFALLGPHGCGEGFGELYADREIEIASDASAWVFFIEKCREPVFEFMGKGLHSGEELLFKRIARVLDIQVLEPVLQPYEHDVVLAIEKKTGRTPVEQAALLASMAMGSADEFYAETKEIEAQSGKRQTEEDKIKDGLTVSQRITEEQIRTYASQFRLSEESIARALQNWNLPNLSEDLKAKAMAQRINVYFEAYGEVVNELSPPRVREALQKSGRPHALYQMGSLHAPIVQKVYSTQ